jgi:hypothetical protein
MECGDPDLAESRDHRFGFERSEMAVGMIEDALRAYGKRKPPPLIGYPNRNCSLGFTRGSKFSIVALSILLPQWTLENEGAGSSPHYYCS